MSSDTSKRTFDKINAHANETTENKESPVKVCKTGRGIAFAAYEEAVQSLRSVIAFAAYEEAVQSFNKAKTWLDEIVDSNDDNPFNVVAAYTDADWNSEDEFVLEVVDKMQLHLIDFLLLTTDEIDKIIKDIEDGKNKMYEFMECRQTITKLKKMPNDDDDIDHNDGWVDSAQYDQNSFGG